MSGKELFEPDGQDDRAELVKRGWSQVGGVGRDGRVFWRNPEHGALMLEDDAFRWLRRQEGAEARAKRGGE